ncbi:MAG TPA: NUDIX domain-containing protein [Candidatus Paceibacterota bacterium]|nr:NUDIX domain-containing protein [Candidatus Paceibacterota bacterium]
MTERFKLIPEVFLILIKDGKVLLSRRANTGYMDGHYGLVAGHAEEHEPMRTALAREAKEEAGITINPQNLRHIVTIHRYCPDPENIHERIGFYFTTDSWKGEILNTEPDKCDDLSWFPISDLPHNTIDYVKEAIGCFVSGQSYLEFGFDHA